LGERGKPASDEGKKQRGEEGKAREHKVGGTACLMSHVTGKYKRSQQHGYIGGRGGSAREKKRRKHRYRGRRRKPRSRDYQEVSAKGKNGEFDRGKLGRDAEGEGLYLLKNPWNVQGCFGGKKTRIEKEVASGDLEEGLSSVEESVSGKTRKRRNEGGKKPEVLERGIRVFLPKR